MEYMKQLFWMWLFVCNHYNLCVILYICYIKLKKKKTKQHINTWAANPHTKKQNLQMTIKTGFYGKLKCNEQDGPPWFSKWESLILFSQRAHTQSTLREI